MGDLPIFAARWWTMTTEAKKTFAIFDKCAILPKFRENALHSEIIDHVLKDVRQVARYNGVVIQYLLVLVPRGTWIEENIVAFGFTLATSDNDCKGWEEIIRGGTPHTYYTKLISV